MSAHSKPSGSEPNAIASDRDRAPARASAWAALMVAALAVAWSSPRWLPFNMDEFIHYHVLGCATAPSAREVEAFRSRCALYDLRPPFTATYLPLRAYLYVGSLPAVVFLPFWAIVDAPVAARVQGAVFFVMDAVRKATSLPAQRLGIRDRGLLREGYYADVVVFDPAAIIDKATYEKPHQFAEGISHVLVNGQVVLDQGRITDARPGMVVRGPGYRPRAD